MWFRVMLVCLAARCIASSECPDAYKELEGHTRCRDDNQNLDTSRSVLTAADKASILMLHNKYRSEVIVMNSIGNLFYPRDLMKLKWDDELAATAQKWANQCVRYHDDFEHRSEPTLPNRHIGQNMNMESQTADELEMDLSSVVTAWYTENNDFIYGEGNGKRVGHFTQLVHNDMTRVGCGYAVCSDQAFLICNYDNTNWMSSRYSPFTPDEDAGNRGADCKESELEDGLCAGTCMALTCLNGGGINIQTCECSCTLGFEGSTCETRNCNGVEDSHDKCSLWTQEGPLWQNSSYRHYLLRNCAFSMCQYPPRYTMQQPVNWNNMQHHGKR